MIFFVNLVFSFISLGLVFTAPNDYSYSYCIMINAFFVLQNALYFILIKDKNLVCFEFFFMLAFWFTNFVYPIFYFPTDPNYSMFSFPFNYAIISKSTAIAYLGYSAFLLGISSFRNTKFVIFKEPFSFNEDQFKWLFYISIISFCLFAFFGGLKSFMDVYSNDGNIRAVGIYSYFYSIFFDVSTLMAMFLLRNKTKSERITYGLFITIVIILFLLTGSRDYPIRIVLILIFTYNVYVKKISKLNLFGLILIGSIILTFIVLARSSNFYEGNWINTVTTRVEISSVFDLFSDLIINNRNLYVLVDFADNNDFIYFLNMISDFLSPIPGLSSYFINKSGLPSDMLIGGAFPTFLEFGNGSSYGIGTNMVGEAYVSFGLFGVVFFFYLIGWIIKTSRNASDYNIYAYIVYYLFVSHIIFYPRAAILFQPRSIIWSLLIILLIKKIDSKNKRIENN